MAGLRVYMSLFWFVAAALLLDYLLTQTKLGNWLQAAGGNAEAARARGVRVERTIILGMMALHSWVDRRQQERR